MKKRAPKPPPSIVLAMMVRNERRVIRRAIESALPFVSQYVIVDTGSTDDTVAVATNALAGKTGEIVSRPWEGYGYNRNELLELARGRGDWLLLLDADEVIEVTGALPDLAADGYEVPLVEGDIASTKTALVRASCPWSYLGDMREVLVCEAKHRIAQTDWARVVHYEDGAQSLRDQYERRTEEAEAFRAALEQSPHDARAAFYRAEALRLAGDLQGAIAAYEFGLLSAVGRKRRSGPCTKSPSSTTAALGLPRATIRCVSPSLRGCTYGRMRSGRVAPSPWSISPTTLPSGGSGRRRSCLRSGRALCPPSKTGSQSTGASPICRSCAGALGTSLRNAASRRVTSHVQRVSGRKSRPYFLARCGLRSNARWSPSGQGARRKHPMGPNVSRCDPRSAQPLAG